MAENKTKLTGASVEKYIAANGLTDEVNAEKR